ncbi:MAG: DUF1926 domain-containing protein [Planctomycetaceae bacterium]|nr:DUF1926 domain-containing protein [Planctomycetales bacterium]MCB9922468.1 DUF1926 domain-containing protein [Planctomycetaceae bacterium]
MTQPIRFCLVLHNHQPIGNFDGVFEQAYQDSYLPFLDVFEPYGDLKISLHTSGPLLEWLDEHHSDYLDRLAALVEAGRVEIIGGSFYEAILAMIPSRDRVGQIKDFSGWLEQRLGATIQGMWIPERVWEQPMTSDIVDAGIKYTVLDDFHFKNAGLNDDELTGYYVTEDDGRTLNVFPGSERLRYLIPFAAPHETIDYLRGIAERHPGAVVTFGDDGEKFGTWPDTHKHVYNDGWLRRFFDGLVENRDWISTTTLADAAQSTPPVGKIYLPDGSYREMTEWVLATDQQVEYENITHEMHDDPRWQRLVRFVRGGYWRNFKVKYPEANEMYSRMLQISRRLAQAEATAGSTDEIKWARRELYRGQCNCGYWHGAFGGIYLPHLRNAIYNHLIAAENLLDKSVGKPATWVEATADDHNFDGRQEVRLANDRMLAFLAPLEGGHIYELDVRSICHNLLATLTRRPEAYHRKVLAGANQDNGHVASIHDRVVFKQEGLDQRLQYDAYARKSLVDHFYDDDASLQSVIAGDSEERSDFRDCGFETKLRKGADRVQVLMSRDGNAFGIPLKLTKGVTLTSGSNELEIAYLLENLPKDRTLHFSVEFNLAGLPSGADDRFFYLGEHENRLGHLGTQLDLIDVEDLGLVDQWLGIDVHWSADRPTHVWTFPIETVSQSEGGFELVHQSVVVQPHWHVRGDANGRWAVTMRLALDTSLAESRSAPQVEESALAH